MKSPWKQIQAIDPASDYLALATAIPARRWSSTPKLFRGASAVRQQLEETPGVVGFSLLARPLRRHYATLSLWTDQAALDAFTAAMPHGRLMQDLAPEMGHTAFVRWTVSGSAEPPSWREAMRRLEGAAGS